MTQVAPNQLNRQKMVSMLTGAMEGNFQSLVEFGHVEKGQNSVKSYLLEVNDDIDQPGATVPERALSTLPRNMKHSLHSSEDPSLFLLSIGSRGSGNATFFLDCLDPRFWILHSTDPAQDSDLAIRNLVLRSRKIDSAWLPSQHFLSWLDRLGISRSLTARFSMPSSLHWESLPDPISEDSGLVFKITASGSARPRWDHYATFEPLRSSMALWSANVARQDDDLVVRDDITAFGKATSRGNSFLLHQELISSVGSLYSQLIHNWEDIYRIRWERKPSGLLPSGSPAEIHFVEPVSESIQQSLLEQLFNSGEPYRLYGVPEYQGTGRFVTRAVDLHTGDSLDLELTRTMLRIYLGANACGNVLARLLTNLQHHFDARLSLEPLA